MTIEEACREDVNASMMWVQLVDHVPPPTSIEQTADGWSWIWGWGNFPQIQIQTNGTKALLNSINYELLGQEFNNFKLREWDINNPVPYELLMAVKLLVLNGMV